MTVMTAKRALGLLLLTVLSASLAFGCKDGDGNGPSNSTPGGVTTLTFWHSMQEPTASVLKSLVDEFNQSQTQYRVNLIYQGGYGDSFTKLRATSSDRPTVIQLSDTFTQIMIDNEVATPVQDFIDDEDYNLSDYEPKAISYYSFDDKLWAMPFNLAGPLLYYDRAAFQDAGLDPDKPPTTLEEVREYSERLVQRDASGKTTRYGISLQVSPWVFEEMLAKAGALYANEDNGRAGRVTEVTFDGPEGQAIIEWWEGMVKDGLAYNAGTDALDQMLKLATGQAAMAIQSTAVLRGAIAAAALTGRDPKQFDAAAMPGPQGEGGGMVVGGAALWVINESSDEQQRGAWALMKFLTEPERQAQWHANTGYFPVRVSSYDLPPAVKARQDFPQFTRAVEQLHASPDVPATAGALLGPFDAIRDLLARAFELSIAGSDPVQELQSAASDANAQIEEYNRTAP